MIYKYECAHSYLADKLTGRYALRVTLKFSETRRQKVRIRKKSEKIIEKKPRFGLRTGPRYCNTAWPRYCNLAPLNEPTRVFSSPKVSIVMHPLCVELGQRALDLPFLEGNGMNKIPCLDESAGRLARGSARLGLARHKRRVATFVTLQAPKEVGQNNK